MKKIKLFARITKVDVAKRLVFGVLAAETPDHSGEIMDYATSKAAFLSWSEIFKAATDGKSAGNLRAMHQSIAAGKFVSVEPNDAEKLIEVCAKVTNDAEWNNVVEGVYTGFSIGGTYGKRWDDPDEPDLTRYTVAKLIEGSLVDYPCIPTAMFSAIKANGEVELCKFKAADPDAFMARLRSAYAAIKASTEKLATFTRSLATGAGLKKGMWSVADLACALATVNSVRMSLKWEAQYEADGSPIPERLRSWIDEGAAILVELVQEETAELTEDEPLNDEMAMLAARVDGIAKQFDEFTAKLSPGAPASGSSAGESSGGAIQGANKPNEVSMTDAEKAAQAAAEDKVTKAITDALGKFESAITTINKKVDDQATAHAAEIKDLSGAIENIGKMVSALAGVKPGPAIVQNAAVATVTKAADGLAVAAPNTEEPKTAHDAIKAALAQPIRVEGNGRP